MNDLLSQIFNTGGHEKLASEYEEIDPSEMTAAELLAGLESGEIIMPDDYEAEKVAADEIDLSDLSARELLELMAEAEEMEAAESQEKVLEKMAADGSFDHYEMAGRIQAHAMWDEFQKLAGSEGEDEFLVDLDQMTAQDLIDLEAEGYTVELEKSAGLGSKVDDIARRGWNATKSGIRRSENWAGKQTRRIGRVQKGYVSAGDKAEKATRMSIVARMREQGMSPKRIQAELKGRTGMARDLAGLEAGSTARERFNRRAGRAAIGGTAALAAGGTAGGVALARRRRKKRR